VWQSLGRYAQGLTGNHCRCNWNSSGSNRSEWQDGGKYRWFFVFMITVAVCLMK